jgi:hypothetical protein
MELLRRHGGVWADATCYCLQPLAEWLPSKLAPAGFFAFDRPAPDRMLASWFLAAQPAWPRRNCGSGNGTFSDVEIDS